MRGILGWLRRLLLCFTATPVHQEPPSKRIEPPPAPTDTSGAWSSIARKISRKNDQPFMTVAIPTFSGQEVRPITVTELATSVISVMPAPDNGSIYYRDGRLFIHVNPRSVVAAHDAIREANYMIWRFDEILRPKTRVPSKPRNRKK